MLAASAVAAIATTLSSLSPQDVPTALRDLAARAGRSARSETIGTSRGGRPIEALTIARGIADDPEQLAHRPGILIVGGADGRRPMDTALAMHQCTILVNSLSEDDAASSTVLDQCAIYIVPQLNPDGYALGRHGNASALDLDRDGSEDEDTPADLDGDGLISHMRWKDNAGTHLIDPDEPRLVREADRDKEERATHFYAVEAIDSDGDDRRAEDDAQGIWIDRTFPHRWDEFDRRTGDYPAREPETRALADFVYARRNIVLAFVWGRDDNLLATPKVEAPKARVQNAGILEDDKSLFEKAGELYREKTGREGDNATRFDGSPWSWLYLQVGVPTFATDIWRAPALEEEDKKDPLLLEKRRLALCESQERGFVEWHEFEHPQLGTVEIGGFVVEDETALLPADERAAIFDAHHEFFLEACTWRPDVRIESFEVEPLSGGAYAVDAVIVNDGPVPAVTATGSRTRRFSVPRIVLETGDAGLAVGRARQRVENLAAHGGRREFSWIVTGAPGTNLSLRLTADPVGGETKEVTL